VFSDEDIKKALEDYQNNPEEGLYIEPFDEQNCLTPVGYDLRVGIEGYSWKQKRIIPIEQEGKIQIEAYDTVVIRTLESLSLSRKVSATIHSIVSLIIPKGLSDISTTIDPGWTGKLLISVHNNRDSSTELRFGDRLCTVCFYRVGLTSKINRGTSNNRVELWERLVEKAEQEKERAAQAEKQQENQRRSKNKTRTLILIMLGIVVLTGGVAASFKKPELGSSIAGFLAVIAPIVYDKLKPISKP
jgi:dCTP deaminase